MGLQTKVDRQGQSGFGALGQTVQERKTTGKGPDIWLAGVPEVLVNWMN